MWNWKWFACLRQDFEKRKEGSGKWEGEGREGRAIADFGMFGKRGPIK